MDNQNIIELHNVDIYQEDNLVLSQVNLEVQSGQMLYLVGRVGSGKSSLIKTITAELPLRTGSGLVCGFDLSNLKRSQIPMLRRKIGVVFQDFQLLTDRNVTDNLLFVLTATGWKDKTAMKQRIAEVLDLVELRYKEYKMPHQLSGGEQQRVVIARALLNNPEAILADEPTGNLDAESSDGIMQILHAIAASGKAVIMATHNVALMRKFPGITCKCERGQLTRIDEQTIDLGSLIEL